MTPKGYSLPAEWAPHAATYLCWPHNRTDWPGKMSAVTWVYGQIVAKLSRHEEVRIVVADKGAKERAKKIVKAEGADLSKVRFHIIPADRSWIRDYGPLTVRNRAGKKLMVDFRFTGWARYPGHKRDNAVAARLARIEKMERNRPTLDGAPVVMEGGAIDVNGRGTLITTEECFLHPTVQIRNQGRTRSDYDQLFRDTLGVTNVVWLGNGIAGDDTHGHVDDLCRFVNRTTLVTVVEKNPQDVNYRPLQENRERLCDVRLEDGARPEVVELPMPAPLHHKGDRLPASYANFYIANGQVLVPTFNDPADREALSILAELFPDREVMGIHAVDLVLGRGTLHCLTMQAPA